MMPILIKSDDVRSGRKTKARHGRLLAAQESMGKRELRRLGRDRVMHERNWTTELRSAIAPCASSLKANQAFRTCLLLGYHEM